MTIAWNDFTPLHSLVGGLLVGLATALYLLGNGRVAGIAGIVSGPLRTLMESPPGASPGRLAARLAAQAPALLVVGGLMLAPWLWRAVAPLPAMVLDVGWPGLVAAGLLVGIGVRMGNGCTSGHGVCGLSRFSLRSLVNVLAFMGAGMATVLVLRHLG
jgi:uncharacterized membrane protein YedE/YeeE